MWQMCETNESYKYIFYILIILYKFIFYLLRAFIRARGPSDQG